jgi:hypothetical protein
MSSIFNFNGERQVRYERSEQIEQSGERENFKFQSHPCLTQDVNKNEVIQAQAGWAWRGVSGSITADFANVYEYEVLN